MYVIAQNVSQWKNADRGYIDPSVYIQPKNT
jgi:hypothetical protein